MEEVSGGCVVCDALTSMLPVMQQNLPGVPGHCQCPLSSGEQQPSLSVMAQACVSRDATSQSVMRADCGNAGLSELSRPADGHRASVSHSCGCTLRGPCIISRGVQMASWCIASTCSLAGGCVARCSQVDVCSAGHPALLHTCALCDTCSHTPYRSCICYDICISCQCGQEGRMQAAGRAGVCTGS